MARQPIVFNLSKLKYQAVEFEEEFFNATQIKVRFRDDLRSATFTFDEEQRAEAGRLFTEALRGRTILDLRRVFTTILGIEVPLYNSPQRTEALRCVEFYWPDGREAHSCTLIRNIIKPKDERPELLLETLAYYMGRLTGTIGYSRLGLAALQKHQLEEGITPEFIVEVLKWDRDQIQAFCDKYMPKGLWRKSK